MDPEDSKSPEEWEKLKAKWIEIKSITSQTKVESIITLCKLIIQKRARLSQVLEMIAQQSAEAEPKFLGFMFEISTFHKLDLNQDSPTKQDDVSMKRNALQVTRALVTLKLLQYDLPPLDPDVMQLLCNESIKNMMLKNLLENADKCVCPVNGTKKITARDMLDSCILNKNPRSLQFIEKSFIRFKKQLVKNVGKTEANTKAILYHEKWAKTTDEKLKDEIVLNCLLSRYTY